MSKLKPLNGHVILKPVEEDEQMYGNIVLPDMENQFTFTGEVIALSEEYNYHSDSYISRGMKIGDKVLIPKMGSNTLVIDNVKHYVVHANTIIAILEK
jgi:co-chaperonin GroES (HSP10)